MSIYEHEKYIEDIEYVANLNLPWKEWEGKTFLISGASGNIASFFIDVLKQKLSKVTIWALGRNEEKAKKRFSKYWSDDDFNFVAKDINEEILLPENTNVDYILHAASNTHPKAYASDPIGTITTNILGTYNLLNFGAAHGCKRFLFSSSVEIYGENRGDVELFDEKYLGYIDCNTMRAGYPESKRCGEALCQAFRAQKDMDVVIIRLSRTYGPTLLSSDTKAISQFIHKAIDGEDIVLKSEGTQFYSYSYVADAVSAMFYCLAYGKDGEAYNVADSGSDIALKDLAEIAASHVGRKVVFELPDVAEAAGYSKATKAVLDSTKLKKLGWLSNYDMKKGMERTIDILKEHK